MCMSSHAARPRPSSGREGGGFHEHDEDRRTASRVAVENTRTVCSGTSHVEVAVLCRGVLFSYSYSKNVWWSSGDHAERSWVLCCVPPTGCPCDFLSSLKSWTSNVNSAENAVQSAW